MSINLILLEKIGTYLNYTWNLMCEINSSLYTYFKKKPINENGHITV